MKELIQSSGALSNSVIQSSGLYPSLKYQPDALNKMLDSMKTNLDHFKGTLMKTPLSSNVSNSSADKEDLQLTSERLLESARKIQENPSAGVLETEMDNYLGLTGDFVRLAKLVAINCEKQDQRKMMNETQNVLATSQAFLSEAVKSNSDPTELSNLKTNVDIAVNLVTENIRHPIDDQNLKEILSLKTQFREFVIDGRPRTEGEKIQNLVKFSTRILLAAQGVIKAETNETIKVSEERTFSFLKIFFYLQKSISAYIEKLNASIDTLSKTATDIVEKPETSRESKEFLKFSIDQMYLNNQELINNIICTRTTHRLGISAKKATISSNDFLTTAGGALEEFPGSHQELRESLLQQTVATSRLDTKLESFFANTEDGWSPDMMEAAGKLTEKWSGLSEQITTLLGELASSDTSTKLLDCLEGFEACCGEMSRAVFDVDVSSADKLLSSALCSVNQHSQQHLAESDRAESQRNIVARTKNIYRKTQGILNGINMKDINLSKSLLELAGDYESLVKNLANLSDTEEIKPWVHNLGKSLLLLSEYIEDDSDDLEPFTLKTVGEPCTKILTSLNESTKKNQIFENVSREFRGLASDIETTIMFASAGTLTPEDESDFKDSRENILKMSHSLVANIKSILTGTTEEKDVLLAAVQESVRTTAGLAEEVKKGAAALSESNQTGQVPTL